VTTYREAVRDIELMNANLIRAAAEDLLRVGRVIQPVLSELFHQKKKFDWEGSARQVADLRLRDCDTVLEALHTAYAMAGAALEDYAEAVRKAKDLVAEGVRAETALGEIIRRHVEDPCSEPMKRWEDLRASQGFFDWLGEYFLQDDVEKIRYEADRRYNTANDCFTRANELEETARNAAIPALYNARRDLPELKTEVAQRQAALNGAPGLRNEILQATAVDPNARRPGQILLEEYQVAEDLRTERFPAEPISWFVQDREVTASEAELLRELQLRHGAVGLYRFKSIHDEVFAEADNRFPSVQANGSPGGDRNNDHNDAFRHTYWNARLTQAFGEDWARRFATAHESLPGNPVTQEAMDLHNNEVGRAIAAANPHATREQLSDLVAQAVREGRTVVVSNDGKTLEYSDQIRPEDTGEPEAVFLPGKPQPVKAATTP